MGQQPFQLTKLQGELLLYAISAEGHSPCLLLLAAYYRDVWDPLPYGLSDVLSDRFG